jgi:hypothetical protein
MNAVNETSEMRSEAHHHDCSADAHKGSALRFATWGMRRCVESSAVGRHTISWKTWYAHDTSPIGANRSLTCSLKFAASVANCMQRRHR